MIQEKLKRKYRSKSQLSFLLFMEDVILTLYKLGRIRTSETYRTTLNSFKRFLNGEDISIGQLNKDIIRAYEMYLKDIGISLNSSSFYMRNLRAVYNRGVEKGLTTQKFPFKGVYTGVEKTRKRAIPLKLSNR
jgi:site-specific recombinase XerD